MLDALVKSFGQLPDPAFRRVLIRGLLAAIVTLVLLAVGVSWLVDWLDIYAADLARGTGWIATLSSWLAAILGFVGYLALTWILFPAVVVAVSGLFLDDVAEAVERRHYPGQPPARPQPLAEAAWSGVRLVLLALVLNLVALPLYFLLPGLNLAIFYGLNGYLLGREYFETAAVRRMTPREAGALRRRYGGRVFAGGVVITALATVPILNLLVPVVGTAFMVHLFNRLQARVTP